MALSKAFTEFAGKLHTETAQSGAAVYIAGISDVEIDQGAAGIVLLGAYTNAVDCVDAGMLCRGGTQIGCV